MGSNPTSRTCFKSLTIFMLMKWEKMTNVLEEFIGHINSLYSNIQDSLEQISVADIENKLEDMRNSTHRYFSLLPVEEKSNVGKYVLLKLAKIAKSMAYVERGKETLPIVYEKAKGVYEIVGGEVGSLAAIEDLTKTINKEETFREVLSFGEVIKRFEAIRTDL
jgi:hypothetical protein